MNRRDWLRQAAMFAVAARQARGGRFALPRADADHLLVPMDDAQSDHLKAYGLAYATLKMSLKSEWLLNYRGGSFLLPDVPEIRKEAALSGVALEEMSDANLAQVRTLIQNSNMDSVPLEKAPRVAVYTPPDAAPWDDAVTLALKYAGISYTAVCDDEVERGDLSKFDWLHLHHEDFTGQFNKFYLGYRDAPWFIEMVQTALKTAQKYGFANVPALKKDVAERIRQFVTNGGFLFAMCGATETLDLALAGHDVDIAQPFSDGTPMDPRRRCEDGLVAGAGLPRRASGDVAVRELDERHRRAPGERPGAPPAAGHVHAVQLLGQVRPCGVDARAGPPQRDQRLLRRHHELHARPRSSRATSCWRSRKGTPWVKYIHGDYGKGTWTYLAGTTPRIPSMPSAIRPPICRCTRTRPDTG